MSKPAAWLEQLQKLNSSSQNGTKNQGSQSAETPENWLPVVVVVVGVALVAVALLRNQPQISLPQWEPEYQESESETNSDWGYGG